MVFMHDNAASHAARLTTKYIWPVFLPDMKKSFNGHAACSPDLNPIEYL